MWADGCSAGAGDAEVAQELGLCVPALSFTEKCLFSNISQRTCCWCILGSFSAHLFTLYLCLVLSPIFAAALEPLLGLGWSVGMEMLCLESSLRQGLFFLNTICRKMMLCAQNHPYLLVLSGVLHCSSVKNQNLLCFCWALMGLFLSQQHSCSGSQISAWGRSVELPKEEKVVKDGVW